MRMYRLIWLDRAVVVTFLLGILIWAVSLTGILPSPLADYAPYGPIVGICAVIAMRVWIAFAVDVNVQYPTSPEGYPVEPSGIWVDDDTALEPGTRVLAQWQGQWWRAVVIGFEAGDRVMVRYLGWSNEWDEPHDRRRLQLVAEPDQPTLDTAIDLRDAPKRTSVDDRIKGSDQRIRDSER